VRSLSVLAGAFASAVIRDLWLAGGNGRVWAFREIRL
jgi:hypothetical protein